MNLTADELENLADALVESHDQLLEKLVAMRKAHHLTQAQVADMMSVSQPTVAAFERYDANPTLSTVRRYALAVGASIRHQISDACCSSRTTTVEAVRAVVAPATTWEGGSESGWEWAPGTVVTRAFVNG